MDKTKAQSAFAASAMDAITRILKLLEGLAGPRSKTPAPAWLMSRKEFAWDRNWTSELAQIDQVVHPSTLKGPSEAVRRGSTSWRASSSTFLATQPASPVPDSPGLARLAL